MAAHYGRQAGASAVGSLRPWCQHPMLTRQASALREGPERSSHIHLPCRRRLWRACAGASRRESVIRCDPPQRSRLQASPRLLILPCADDEFNSHAHMPMLSEPPACARCSGCYKPRVSMNTCSMYRWQSTASGQASKVAAESFWSVLADACRAPLPVSWRTAAPVPHPFLWWDAEGACWTVHRPAP